MYDISVRDGLYSGWLDFMFSSILCLFLILMVLLLILTVVPPIIVNIYGAVLMSYGLYHVVGGSYS